MPDHFKPIKWIVFSDKDSTLPVGYVEHLLIKSEDKYEATTMDGSIPLWFDTLEQAISWLREPS